MAWDTTKAFSKGFRVAVVTPGRDLRAACHRIPSRIRPFYRWVL